MKIVDPKYKHSVQELCRGSKWSSISQEAKEFVGACLVKTPEERLTIQEVLQHPWLARNTDPEKTTDDTALADLTDRGQEFRRAELRRRFRKAVNTVRAVNRMSAWDAA